MMPVTANELAGGMKMVKADAIYAAVVGGVLMTCAAPAWAQVPGFVNGGFETPAVGAGSFQPGFAGSSWGGSSYANFAGIASNSSWVTQYNPAAPEGTQVAFLMAAWGVSQWIWLPAGNYYISFKAASGPDYTGYLGSPAGVSVVMDGVTLLLNKTFAQGDYTYNMINTQSFTISTPGSHFFFIRGSSGTLLLDDVKLVTNNALPAVAITSPTSNSSFALPVNIAFSAAASDSDGTVQSVQYYSGATPISAALTSPPYTFNWTHVPPGQYSITAKAIDDRGGATMSTPVTIGTVAVGYDMLPAITLTGGNGNLWTTSPPANVARRTDDADKNNVEYAINQSSDLTSYEAIGQRLSFQITIDTTSPTTSLLHGTAVTDHIVVGLNHRVYFGANLEPNQNQFIGVAIGNFGYGCTSSGGIGIEWKDLQGNYQVLPTCIALTDDTSRSVIVDFMAYSNSCAVLSVYKTTLELIGQLTSCGTTYYPSFVSSLAGVAVAALTNTTAGTSYSVTIQPISQSLIFPW